jgi:hypothetical protein
MNYVGIHATNRSFELLVMDSVELSLRIFGILHSFLGDEHFKARNEPSMHCRLGIMDNRRELVWTLSALWPC